MDSPIAGTTVTVAIPTFRRPELLRRALECLARQNHAAMEVLVSDNATEGAEVEAVVESFRGRLPGLVYNKHPHNIGAIDNFFYCLERASGAYFMWLADDDELSPAAVEALATALDSDRHAVTAVPRWLLYTTADRSVPMPSRSYDSDHRLARVAKYVWRSNDAFFYALHRTEVLRRAYRVEYAWPNRGLLMNWAYPYLLDQVIAGKVIAVDRDDVVWINHDYSEKSYDRPRGGLGNLLRTLARRINVHMIYLGKVSRLMGVAACVVILPVSIASLTVEVAVGAVRKLRRWWAGRLASSVPHGGAT